MGFAAVTKKSFLQELEESYRRAFRSFVQASEELMHLQQAGNVNLGQIQDANVRIRDAQMACRNARDKLARFLLAKRRETLQRGLTPEPLGFKSLNFVRQVESLLAGDQTFASTCQKTVRTPENAGRRAQA